MWLRASLLAAVLIAWVSPAAAQVPLVVRVVASCGTVPTAYVAGSNQPAVMDVNGNFCTNASGGGGGGGTSSNFGAAFPSAGTAIGCSDGTNMVACGTATNPLRINPTGTTAQPVTAASGAFAAGSHAAGAGVDGWDLSVGATTATAATAGSTGTVQAKLRLMTTQLDNINTNIQGAVPCLNATAFNTNSYSNAGTNPANCDLNGGLYVHPPANQSVAQATAALLNATVVGTGTFVTQSALTATEVHAGEIGSNQIKVQVAQTVTASSAYTSGNAIGGLMTIAGAARVSGSLGAAGTGGILSGMVMNSKSLQTTQVDVVFFDANPTGSTCTDKTAFSLATADFDKVVGYLTIPGTAANGAGWVAGTVGSLGIPTYYPVTYDLASATSIYACAVTRGTPTWTATTDVSFKFNFLRN